MSSDLYVYGVFLFPAKARAAWLGADLPESEEEEEHRDLGVSFQGTSEYGTVKEAINNAKRVHRFLDLLKEGEDKLVIRGVLGDDDWYPWTTTLGAMARAAVALEATGYLEVLDDGTYMGRLVLKGSQVAFQARAKQADQAGEKELMARFEVWLTEEAASSAKKVATKPKAAEKPKAATNSKAATNVKAASKPKAVKATQPAKKAT